jgi:hypothetical protein
MIGKEFILAGRATFTLCGPNGGHISYRVSRKPGTDVYFVRCNRGGTEASGFKYLGLLNPATGDVTLRGRTAFAYTDLEVRVLRRMLPAYVWPGKPLPDGYGAMHAGRCGRCAKQLTDPPSIERGIGPECWKKMGLAA